MLFQARTTSRLVASCGCRTVQPPRSPPAYLPAGDRGPVHLAASPVALGSACGHLNPPGSMQAVISPGCAVQLPKLLCLVPRWGVWDSHVDLARVTRCRDLPSGAADGGQAGDHGLRRRAPDAHAEAAGSHPALYSDPCLHRMDSSALWYICVTLQSPLTPSLWTATGA